MSRIRALYPQPLLQGFAGSLLLTLVACTGHWFILRTGKQLKLMVIAGLHGLSGRRKRLPSRAENG